MMNLLSMASFVASLVIVAIAFILVPEQSLNQITIASLIIFALSISFSLYIPHLFTSKKGNSDAVQIASLGPVGVITSAMFVLSAIAFVLALADLQKLALAMDVLVVGLFIICILVLSAALKAIGDSSEVSSQVSNHIKWQNMVKTLVSISSNSETKINLDKLVETFRYSANDGKDITPHDQKIEGLLQNLLEKVTSDKTIYPETELVELESLVAQRNIFLSSIRSRG